MSAGRQGLLLVATALLLLGCVMHEPYLDWSHYLGDAEVWEDKDPGLGSTDDIYPRYFVIFPSVDMGDSSPREFTATGIPYYDYGFGLAADTDSDWRTIRSSGLRCYVDIEEMESGKTLHLGGELGHGDTRKKEGWLTDVRYLKGIRHGVFVPTQLNVSTRFRPNPFRTYRIRIRTELPATEANSSSTHLPSLVPILWAGSGDGSMP